MCKIFFINNSNAIKCMKIKEISACIGICFDSVGIHPEWWHFSIILRLLRCKVLCERGAIAKALEAMRCAPGSL